MIARMRTPCYFTKWSTSPFRATAQAHPPPARSTSVGSSVTWLTRRRTPKHRAELRGRAANRSRSVFLRQWLLVQPRFERGRSCLRTNHSQAQASAVIGSHFKMTAPLVASNRSRAKIVTAHAQPPITATSTITFITVTRIALCCRTLASASCTA